MKPRNYQTKLINDIYSSFKEGNKHVLCQAPTGSGKTFIFSLIAKKTADKGNKVLILSDRTELLLQTGSSLKRLDLMPYPIQAGSKQVNNNFLVYNAMSQTFKKRIELEYWQKFLSEIKLIIIDEAHNIMSKSSDRESETWKDYRLETFEEIIKEGRKLGVFLTIASQRPSDISPTILSQLHNYFLHRLINNNDILAVEKTISYLDKVSFEYLPILPTGSCVVAGLSAQVPVVIDIGSIKKEFEPKSSTINLIKNWTKDE